MEIAAEIIRNHLYDIRWKVLTRPSPADVDYASSQTTMLTIDSNYNVGGIGTNRPGGVVKPSYQPSDITYRRESGNGGCLYYTIPHHIPGSPYNWNTACYTEFMDCLRRVLGDDVYIKYDTHTEEKALVIKIDVLQFSKSVEAREKALSPYGMSSSTASSSSPPSSLTGLRDDIDSDDSSEIDSDDDDDDEPRKHGLTEKKKKKKRYEKEVRSVLKKGLLPVRIGILVLFLSIMYVVFGGYVRWDDYLPKSKS